MIQLYNRVKKQTPASKLSIDAGVIFISFLRGGASQSNFTILYLLF